MGEKILKTKFVNGDIFAVWKKKGISSYKVVAEIKKLTGVKKVGHAGTLDPLAEGILVVGIGREATKRLHEIVASEKEYVATIRLGMTSTTDDEEGEKTETQMKLFPGHAHAAKKEHNQLSNDRKIVDCVPSKTDTEKILHGFEGKIMQTPPPYSAVKIGGQRAYRLARAGKKFEILPREVEIKKIEILDYHWPILKIRVVTGPGVYIRALARDIGEKLEVGGYMKSLVRTRVGTYTKENAIDEI